MPLKIRLLLSAILLLSFTLQIAPILTNSIYFGFDQGLDQLLVKHIANDHRFILVGRYSGLQGILMGPFWTYFMVIPFIFSRGDPAANVLFLSVFSIYFALIASQYFRIINPKIFWPTLIFLLFTPGFIDSSRIVTSPNPLVFIFPLFIYLLFQLIEKNNERLLIWLWVLIAIFFQLEIAFAIYTPILLVATILILGKRKMLLSKFNFLGLLLFAISLIPQLLFDLRHNFLMVKGLSGFFSGTNSSLALGSNSILTRFIFRSQSLFEDAVSMAMYPQNLFFSGVLFFVCLFKWIEIIKTDRRLKLLLKLLILSLSVFYLGFTLYPGPIWSWYRAGLPIVFILLVSIPLGFFWAEKGFKKVMALIFASLFVVQTLVRLNFPVNLWKSDESFVGSLKNQKNIIDHIYKLSDGNKFFYYAYTPPVYDYIWQYDFWWYGQQKYGYLPLNWSESIPLLGIGTQVSPPKQFDKGKVMLIIEPNYERPGEPQYWLRNFIQFGTTVNSKRFPGNIMVEQRLIQ